jgi:hypothetical protein
MAELLKALLNMNNICFELQQLGNFSRVSWAAVKVRIEFWWGNLMERDHFGDLDVDERITLKLIFKEYDESCIEFTLVQNRDN